MVGITSYGAYVPFWRLSWEAIAPGLTGEKAIANFDEDSITMAVAAAVDCLNGIDRKEIDGLFFASTTSPYAEKQASTTIATALDLRTDIACADLTSSLRGATLALRSAVDAVKAGSAKKVLVVAADCRLGAPGSDGERNGGDGAGAVIISDADVAVSIEAFYSINDEMVDVWRADGDTFVQSWQDRFITSQGYLKVVQQAAAGVMKKCNLGPTDFAKAVFYTPDARRVTEVARSLGFDPRVQVQNPLIGAMGNTGAAFPLMLLVAALEEAKAGDRILLASYGSGSDALVLLVTEQIEKIRDRRGMKRHLESKKVITDYKTYLHWRDIVGIQAARRPETAPPSSSALWRERDWNIRFHGVKCKACGTVQYPPQRVCTRCRAKDDFDSVRLSDKKGEVFTYAMDYISSAKDIPLVIAVVNLEGGGRVMTMMTDRVPEDLKVGMTVEMSFRKLYSAGGIHNYFWKSVPLRG